MIDLVSFLTGAVTGIGLFITVIMMLIWYRMKHNSP